MFFVIWVRMFRVGLFFREGGMERMGDERVEMVVERDWRVC